MNKYVKFFIVVLIVCIITAVGINLAKYLYTLDITRIAKEVSFKDLITGSLSLKVLIAYFRVIMTLLITFAINYLILSEVYDLD